MDERELIRGLMVGDDRAFNKLIDLYGNDILRLCYIKTSDIHVAEDLTQETLIAIFKYINKFKGQSSLKTWIYKIALNNCNKYFSKIKKENNVTYMDFNREQSNLIEEEFSDELLKVENKEFILEAIETMDKKYKEVIYMFYYDELSIKEIGEVLDKRINTIKTLLRRGRRELEETIRRDLYA